MARLASFTSVLGACFTAVLAAAGCSGTIEGRTQGDDRAPGAAEPGAQPRPPSAGAGAPPPSPSSPTLSPATPSATPADTTPAGRISAPGSFRGARAETFGLLRLSVDQYRYVVMDVLGVSDLTTEHLLRAAPADDSVSPKDLADGYHKTAVLVAQRATASGGAAARVCAVATPDAACATRVVEQIGPLLFRRPLAPDEVARYAAIFTASLELGAPAALEQTLVGLLLSPSFVYVIESPGATAERLPEEQIATRLSLLLWDSAPDGELLADAMAGKLRDRAAFEATVTRMRSSPKHARFPARFFESWFDAAAVTGVQKSAALAGVLTAGMAASMARETQLFLKNVLDGPKSDFAELVTATASYLDTNTAKIYGITDPKLTSTPTRFEIPPANPRAGVLTQPAILTQLGLPDRGSVVMRGIWVLERLLCSPPAIPPVDVGDLPDTTAAGKTQRARLAAHRAQPVCAACHESIDGIGLGLEAYDAIGRHADTENGVKLDGAGAFVTPSGERKSFRGAVELGKLVAASEEARLCFIDQWFERNLHRKPTAADARALGPIAQRFTASGNMREVLDGYLASPAFVSRTFR